MLKIPIVCAYCGFSPPNKKDLTSDHIPPKKLFPKPRPANIITVPACRNCHANTSKDDEYFCLKISMRNDAQRNSAARTIAHELIGSLGRVQSIDFRRQILSDLRVANLRTASGLYTGQRVVAYDVDMVRIFKVLERIVRGLYFVETGKPLGLQNEVRSNAIEEIQQQTVFLEQLKQVIPSMAQGEKIGDDVFTYRYILVPNKQEFSAWIISLYNRVIFFSMTGPPLSNSTEPN